jgi:hypothetical protein
MKVPWPWHCTFVLGHYKLLWLWGQIKNETRRPIRAHPAQCTSARAVFSVRVRPYSCTAVQLYVRSTAVRLLYSCTVTCDDFDLPACACFCAWPCLCSRVLYSSRSSLVNSSEQHSKQHAAAVSTGPIQLLYTVVEIVNASEQLAGSRNSLQNRVQLSSCSPCGCTDTPQTTDAAAIQGPPPRRPAWPCGLGTVTGGHGYRGGRRIRVQAGVVVGWRAGHSERRR